MEDRQSTRTKLGAGQDPFVEDDDARAQGDPQSNVEGRMEPTAGAGAGRGLGRLGVAGLQPPVCLGGGAFTCHWDCRAVGGLVRARSSCGGGDHRIPNGLKQRGGLKVDGAEIDLRSGRRGRGRESYMVGRDDVVVLLMQLRIDRWKQMRRSNKGTVG